MKQQEPDRHSLTRRTLIRTGAGMGGVLAIGAAGAAVPNVAAFQIDSTPPAPPVPVSSDPIADLAAALQYDQEAIFAFVRDEIHYETYAGVLRGAKGTLWARAGNSADQAVLLGALLGASQIPYRFATAALSADQSTTLTNDLRLSQSDATARSMAVTMDAFGGAAGSEPAGATPQAATPEADTALQQAADQGKTLANRASDLVATIREPLAKALADAGLTLPDLPDVTLAPTETTDHTWVQVPDGPDWNDLDPTIPHGPASTPATTVDTPPDAWYHQITFRVVAEDLYGGALSPRDVVTLTTTSQRIVDVPIAINFAPAEAIAGLGSTINQLFTGQISILPSIYADGVSVDASQPCIFATDGATAIGAFDTGTPVAGAGEGETVAVWLVVDITSPNAPPRTIERAIVDRVPATQRASGTIDPTTITPIQTAPSAFQADELTTLKQFNSLILLHCDVARIPSIYALQRARDDTTMGTLHSFGPSMASLRDGLGDRHEGEAGVWSYPSGPNITAFTFETGSDDTPGRIAVDMVLRQRTSLPLTDGDPPDIHPLVLSGILNAVAEQATIMPVADTSDARPVTPSIGAITAQAVQDNIAFTVVRSTDDLLSLSLEDKATLRITQALDAGNVVIIPTKPVEIGGLPALGWWQVDPTTGITTDQLVDGTSGASTQTHPRSSIARYGDTLPFYTRWINWLTENRVIINCIGTVVGAVVGAAAFILTFVGLTGPVLAALGAAKAVSDLYKIPNACLG